LYGRLGPPAHVGRSLGHGLALPCRGCYPRNRFRKCTRKTSVLDLGGVRVFPPIPGRRLDARALPKLRPPRLGFWRLPLSGIPDYRRRGRNRSRLFTGTDSQVDRRAARAGEFSHKPWLSFGASTRISRPVDLPFSARLIIMVIVTPKQILASLPRPSAVQAQPP